MPRMALLMGSYRKNANGRRVMRFFEGIAKEGGWGRKVVSGRALNVSFLADTYAKLKDPPSCLKTLQEIFHQCDGFLLISGEYNHLPQPGLLNMLNFFYQEYAGKVAGLVTYSVGLYGGMRSEAALRTFTAALNLITLPHMFTIGKITQEIDENGQTLDKELQKKALSFCLDMLKLLK